MMATTAAPVASRQDRNNGFSSNTLSDTLQRSPQVFLQPTQDILQAALSAAKDVLDTLATEVADTQTARRNEARRKRKRGSDEVEDPVLQLRQIYTRGLAVKQVWEQARRVLDAACDEVERDTEELRARSEPALLEGTTTGILASDEEGGSEDEEDVELGESDLSGQSGGEEEGEIDAEDVEDEDMEDIEHMEDDSDILVLEEEEAQPSKPKSKSQKPGEVYVRDTHGLNDGFFSIDDFNKQSQFLEQMDARGDDENPSDEDEIDWDANPLSQAFSKSKPDLSNGNEDEEEGPTFGDYVAGDDSDDDADDVELVDESALGGGGIAGLANTNDVRYTDFFEPPPKKPSKTKRMRALPKTQPPEEGPFSDADDDGVAADEITQADLDRAMADVRRDLLDSDEEMYSEDDQSQNGSDSDTGFDNKPKSKSKVKAKNKDRNLSTHEKQRAEIAVEIRRLEAANVSKKDWTLSGEAGAQARPLNSLVEEDLEFERTGKPVPVITAEISEDIEALIKRRILAREFDEVLRRHATSVSVSGPETRRGVVTVDDSKSKLGLGELYEQEHLRAADPNAYIDKRSAATRRHHEEIDRLWVEVRDQLDQLSNLHFKPKRTAIEMKTIDDKPRIAMEDARPAISLDDSGNNNDMLAPQEVYKPGVDTSAEQGQIITRGGQSLSKEELTREEKLRRRRREKERVKKGGSSSNAAAAAAAATATAGAQKDVATGSGKAEKSGRPGKKGRKGESTADKQNIFEQLKRGGVRLIGKGGELQDLSSNKHKTRRGLGEDGAGAGAGTSSALKL